MSDDRLVETLLDQLRHAATMRALELPAPPPGFRWHPTTERVTDEQGDAQNTARLVTRWELRRAVQCGHE